MSAPTLQTEMANALNELKPFRDVNGMFYVQLMIPDAEDETEARDAPLSSSVVRDHINLRLGKYTRRGYLSKQEEEKVFAMIRAYARIQPPRKPDLHVQETTDLGPLAQAIMKLAEKGPVTATVLDLLGKVNLVRQESGIGIPNPETWPTTEDQLGRQLHDLIPVLKAQGVLLARHGTSRPRLWSIMLEADLPAGRHDRDENASVRKPVLSLTYRQADTSAVVQSAVPREQTTVEQGGAGS
jgi:hypothetical protein